MARKITTVAALILISLTHTGCETQYRPATWNDVSSEVNGLKEDATRQGTIDATATSSDLDRFGDLTTWDSQNSLGDAGSQSSRPVPRALSSTLPGRSAGQVIELSTLPLRKMPSSIGTLPSRTLTKQGLGANGSMTTLPGNPIQRGDERGLPSLRDSSDASRRNTTLPGRGTIQPFREESNRSSFIPGSTLPHRTRGN